MLLEGHYADIQNILTSELKENDSRQYVLVALGNTSFKFKRFHAAFLHYEKALSASLATNSAMRVSSISKIMYNLALLAIRSNHFVEAFYLIGFAIAIYPSLASNPFAVFRLAESALHSEFQIIQDQQRQLSVYRYPITIKRLESNKSILRLVPSVQNCAR
jgi:hypothetical protein